jgi:nitrous-oxide reductase
MRSENDQLLDISSDTVPPRIVHDGTAYPEPHDAVIVFRDIINPDQVQDRESPRIKWQEELAAEDGITDLKGTNQVIRKSDKFVRVYMTSMAPAFSMTEIRVKAGDTVQMIVTNIDNVEDLSHGFCLVQHDVNFCVNAQDTNSMTFEVPNPGVYWYYCPWFCHALHLEMRGRLIVEPR